MDRDTIANHIHNLSKVKFDRVATLVLSRVFSLEFVDTDAKGDSGFDYIVLRDWTGSSDVAFQRTTQLQRWEQKAISDSKSAKKRGATRFIFLTSRIHDLKKLLDLENEITTDVGLAAR